MKLAIQLKESEDKNKELQEELNQQNLSNSMSDNKSVESVRLKNETVASNKSRMTQDASSDGLKLENNSVESSIVTNRMQYINLKEKLEVCTMDKCGDPIK